MGLASRDDNAKWSYKHGKYVGAGTLAVRPTRQPGERTDGEEHYITDIGIDALRKEHSHCPSPETCTVCLLLVSINNLKLDLEEWERKQRRVEDQEHRERKAWDALQMDVASWKGRAELAEAHLQAVRDVIPGL